jgi:SAM-dependent methyltransferase
MSPSLQTTPSTSAPSRLHDWLQTPPGAYLRHWETQEFERSVVDVFGYHALQLGLPRIDTLQANRMLNQWLALDDAAALHAFDGHSHPALQFPQHSFLTDFDALPFPEASLDLVTLPHTLELSGDPHGTLSEVHRVLVPEGRVVICGLNPTSLWGFRQRRAQLYQRFGFGEPYVPDTLEWIGYRRLRDWLRLLSFEVESVRFGVYRPAVHSQQSLDNTAWLDLIGSRWWPILGGVYFVVAVKRVRGMTLIRQAWKASPKMAGAPVSVASSAHSTNLTAVSVSTQHHNNEKTL